MWKEGINQIAALNLPIERLEQKKKRLDALRPLPAAGLKRLMETLAIEWTFHSNAIEGNTLTLNETRAVLEDGITVKGKSLREHLEVVNHYEAIEKVIALAKPELTLTEGLILDMHKIVLDKIEKDYAGRYRNVGVRITGANFLPPNYVKVPDLMADLMDWINANSSQLHPLWLAILFHHRFVWIHPFIDGNGRTVRLLSGLLMMRAGYPPAIILKADRKKYYDALNLANAGNFEKFSLLVLQAAERSLDIYLTIFDPTMAEYKPITDVANEDAVPYGEEYIGLLARRGKIDAYKEGKVWYTTKEAVSNYMAGRKRVRTFS